MKVVEQKENEILIPLPPKPASDVGRIQELGERVQALTTVIIKTYF